MDMEPERIDPVSGNEIPLGAVAENVRDDIPAQLSEGEYVVPADVVNYYGVKFFEDLRSEAKEGFQEMAETGRIGGEPMDAPMDDSFPFDVSELQTDGGEVSGFSEGGFSLPPRDYTRSAPTATVAPTRIQATDEISAQAEARTGRRLNRGLYGGQSVTSRRFVNPRTGQVVTMKGVNVPGSLKLSDMERDPETGKLTGQSSGPTFQPIDRTGRAYQIPAGFVPLESLSEGDPYYQEGYTPYGFGAGFEGLGEYAQRRRFDPFMSRGEDGNLQGSATVFRNDYAGRPDMQFEGFDRRKGYRDMDLAGLVDSFDERMATGKYEGQEEGRIGMFGGDFGSYETNKILRAEEDILNIDVQLQDPNITPEQTQQLRAARAQYAAELTRMQNVLYDKGLDMDADGLEDSFVEKFSAGSAMEENEGLDGLRGLAQLGSGFMQDDTADTRVTRAEQGKAARQKAAEAASRIQGYMSAPSTYTGAHPTSTTPVTGEDVTYQPSAAPTQPEPAPAVPAYTPSMSLPTPVVPGITTRPTYAEMGVPTVADPLDVPASTSRPNVISSFIPAADAQTVPLSPPTGTSRPAVTPTPAPSVQEQRARVQEALAASDRLASSLDMEADSTNYRPMPNFAMPPSPRRSSTLLQDRAAETGYSNALNVPAQQGNPFMQRRMYNEGGMVQGYQQGGIAYSAPQMRMEEGVPVADSSIRSQVQAALMKRKKGLEGPSVAEQANQLRQERSAMTASERAAGRRQGISNFFAPAFQAVGTGLDAAGDAIGSGMQRITGSATPMQSMMSGARTAMDAGMDLAEDTVDYIGEASTNVADRLTGQEARDAYQAGYDAGFAAGQRAVRADTAGADARSMMRGAQSQASAIDAAQQAQAASDAASMAGARSRYIDQLDNQEIGEFNMGVLERRRAREAAERQRAMARAAGSQQQGFQQRSQDAARYEEQARQRAEAAELERQALARRAEQQAQREAQLEAERRMRAEFNAKQAQRRFESDAQLAAMYEANNQLEALLAESDDLDSQEERLVNQYQRSTQGE